MIEEKHDKNETFLYEKSRCSLVVGFEKIGSIIFYMAIKVLLIQDYTYRK